MRPELMFRFLETAYDALLSRYMTNADAEDVTPDAEISAAASEFSDALLEMDPRTLASMLVVGLMKNAILLSDLQAANQRLESVKPGTGEAA